MNVVKLRYDREEDILMIEVIPEGVIDRAEQAGPLIPHFTETGRLVLLEILDASEFLSQVIRAMLRSETEEVPLAVG
jgi:uncharacterized protein YuzE